MKELCGDQAYSVWYLKEKLIEHLGDSVIITEINGKENVVTIKTTASSILHDFYRQAKSEDLQAETLKILRTAAKLIKRDIKSMDVSKDSYPGAHEISSVEENTRFVPDSLVYFLREMLSEKNANIKLCSIGQAMMQAVCPRTLIAPLQLGLAVQLHHHFSSKYLIDILNSLGFCVSYLEVQMFEASAVVTNASDITNYQDGMFCQYVADNVDHNLHTLDGHNTFHGMGMIACVTPGHLSDVSVKRQTVSVDDVLSAGKIDILYYRPPETTKRSIHLLQLNNIRALDHSHKLSFLSQITWPLRNPGPEWSGFMQLVRSGDYPGKSSVVFLPMIDMEPGDMSCIYTTLNYISNHASKYNQTAIVTFDQPLYWKAATIIENESNTSAVNDIVVRLGGFHCIMSYLGCIGQLMSGSGLNELLETVYATNVIPHMLSGKAVSRAIRGHFLATNALNIILMCQISEHNITSATNNEETVLTLESENSNTDFSEMVDLYEKLVRGEITVDSVYNHDGLDAMFKSFLEAKNRLSQYPTAALWIQYIKMIDTLKSFITAERTGNWESSLQSMTEMLPYFAAAGHNLYLKSVYFYLQCMQNLPQTHPDVHKAFLSGYHVIRRSDRYWAGLSTDLVIEQALMRSVKTVGGMTRGKGLTEYQLAQWLLSMPSCVEINNAMQLFCGKEYQSNPQHKELGQSRKNRDFKDTQTFITFLSERSPFREDACLFNIETGVTSDLTVVNAHQSEIVGDKVIKSMIGQNVFDIGFKKSQKATTMNSTPSKSK